MKIPKLKDLIEEEVTTLREEQTRCWVCGYLQKEHQEYTISFNGASSTPISVCPGTPLYTI